MVECEIGAFEKRNERSFVLTTRHYLGWKLLSYTYFCTLQNEPRRSDVAQQFHSRRRNGSRSHVITQNLSSMRKDNNQNFSGTKFELSGCQTFTTSHQMALGTATATFTEFRKVRSYRMQERLPRMHPRWASMAQLATLNFRSSGMPIIEVQLGCAQGDISGS